MSSISNFLYLLRAQSVNHSNGACEFKEVNASNMKLLWFSSCRLRLSFQKMRGLEVKAAAYSIDSSGREQGEGGVRVDFSRKGSYSDRRGSAFHGITGGLPSFDTLQREGDFTPMDSPSASTPSDLEELYSLELAAIMMEVVASLAGAHQCVVVDQKSLHHLAPMVDGGTNHRTSQEAQKLQQVVKRSTGSKSAIGFSLAVTVVLIVARQIMSRKNSHNQQGSVAELVKRGQLRSDKRGISKPLKYEDPFNNPQVKIEKNNSKLEMCGKVYRLAPVTLTKEEQLAHQRRRSRAYQWKRPAVFLREGDLVPPDIDPDTIKWIPANHPFATTVPEIDESLAQNNVFQKDGVPFRIRAEHEALQKKLEALQTAQKEQGINQKNIHENEPEKSTGPSVIELEPTPPDQRND